MRIKAPAALSFCLAACVLCSSCAANAVNVINHGLPGALASGNLERVKEAVERGANLSDETVLLGPDANPLYYSMRNGQACIPEYLLSRGANPNYVDSNGISLLMYTVGARKDSGIDYVNVQERGYYQLLLSDPRTKINLRGKKGYTALDYACLDAGETETVNDLLSHGAEITPVTMKCAVRGFSGGFCEASVVRLIADKLAAKGTPLGVDPAVEAAVKGDDAGLLALDRAGKIKKADRSTVVFLAAAFCSADTLKVFADEQFDLNADLGGRTLIRVACACGRTDIVRFLVGRGVPITAQSKHGETDNPATEPLLTTTVRYGRLETMEYLLESGAGFRVYENDPEQSDLALACRAGDLALVKSVVAHNFPLTEAQLSGAMIVAASYDRLNVLDYFLTEKKANIDAQHGGETALTASAGVAKPATVKYLVEHGANVNGTKEYTALVFAVTANRTDVASYLIGRGADAGRLGSSTTTSLLTTAVQHGYFDMVKLLVEHGADPGKLENWPKNSKTPLQVAKERGSEHITRYLENAVKSQSGK